MKNPHSKQIRRRFAGLASCMALLCGAPVAAEASAATVLDFQNLALGPLDGQAGWTYPEGTPLPQEEVLVAPGGLYWVGSDDGVIPGGTQYLRTRTGLDGNGRMTGFASLAGVEVEGPLYVRFLLRLDERPPGIFGNEEYQMFFGFAESTGFPTGTYVSLKHPVTGTDPVGVETAKVLADGELPQNSGVMENPRLVFGETLLVVFRYNVNEDGDLVGIDVWLNPSAADEAEPDHAVSFELPGVNLAAQTHFNVSARTMPIAMDSIIFSSAWDDVVPPAWDGTPRPPVVLLPPTSPEGEIGDISELSVLLLEDPDNPVTGYQWELNGATPIPAGFGGTAHPFPFQFWTGFGATNPVRLAAHNPDVPRIGSNMNVIVSNAAGQTSTPLVRIREARAPEPPEIVAQPREFTEAMDGDTVLLSVEVFSLIDVTYLWFFEGEPIGGAVEDTLRLTNFTESDAGTYHVEITNDLGTTRSEDAVIAYDDGSFPEDGRVVRLARGSGLGENIAAEGIVDDQIGEGLSPHDPADEPPTIASIPVAEFSTRIAQAYAENRGGVFDFDPANAEILSGPELTGEEIDENVMRRIKRFHLDLGGGEIPVTPLVRHLGGINEGHVGRDYESPNFLVATGFQPRFQEAAGEVMMAALSQPLQSLPSTGEHTLASNSYLKLLFDPEDKVDLVGFVFINRDYFQSHRSTKAFPDKPNVRATARFTNGTDTITNISTGTTAQGDDVVALGYNTFFGFESPGEGYYLKDVEVWALGNNWRCLFSVDDLAVAVAEIDPGEPGDGPLDEWLADAGVPADRRGPDERNGPLLLTNLEAYAMGIPPLTATAQDLPRTERDPDDPNRVRFTYSLNTAAEGVVTGIEQSTDLAVWVPATPLEDNLVLEDGDLQVREAVFAIDAESPVFLRVAADLED